MDRSFDTLDELTARLELDAAVISHCAKDDEAKRSQWDHFQATFRGLKMEMELTRQRLINAEEQNRKQAEAQADAANRAKSQFLANMSHEIRTPLNNILGFADIIQRGSISAADTAEYLDIIVNSGQHLVELVDEVLDVSRLESGRMQIDRQPCVLRPLMNDVIALLNQQASERQNTLTFGVSSNVPSVITTDRLRLRQILLNLVGNALKFTSRGSVSVECELQANDDPSALSNQLLAIYVTDTGIGIPADRLDAIFEPFVQSDSSTTRQYGGTGLGLTVSRSLAQLLGGTLTVTSSPGVGSRFAVTIDPHPVIDSMPTGVEASPSLDCPTLVDLLPQPESRRRKLLVVDDVVTNRRYLRLILKRAGYDIVEAENGEKALAALGDEDVDLVLMDLQMPVLDGYRATEELRSSGIDIPVIAVTANAFEASRQKSQKAGCNAWLTKPVDPDMLLDEISKQLEAVTT